MTTTDLATYTAALESWRADAEAALRDPEGWLSVAGLFWLGEGERTMGSDPGCDVVLPPGSAPAHVARLAVRDGAITILEAIPELRVNDAPPREGPLHGPSSDSRDRITVGRLVIHVHEAGDRVGLRVRDPEHPDRTGFPGRRWYPPRPELRVAARFVPFDPPRPVTVVNLLGDAEDDLCPGYVRFTLDGQELELEASGDAGNRRMGLVFRDATSGVETYGAARFLTFDIGEDGSVDLDFNRAVCPPCAFTPFATCPLPSPQNRLTIAIRAGELAPAGQ